MSVNNMTTDIDLSKIPTQVLENELKRREGLESDESRIRIILNKLSISELEFMYYSISDNPIWVLSEFRRILVSAYDP